MTIFSKRNTLVENIAYMGIMAAINVLFVLLTTLFPALLFLIVFVLPLTSVIVITYCNKRYFSIYAFATIGLCLIVTMWNVGDTLFYVIPSIISGLVFGLLLNRKLDPFWVILIATSIQVVFSYLSIPFIKWVTNVDIVYVFICTFKVNDFPYIEYLVPSFIFFISLVQEIISYIVIKNGFERFRIIGRKEEINSLILAITNIFMLGIMVVFAFFLKEYTLLILCISICIGAYEFADLIISKNTIVYILLGVSLIVSFFFFGILYTKLTEPMGVLLLGLSSFLVSIIALINNYLLKRKTKYTINEK